MTGHPAPPGDEDPSVATEVFVFELPSDVGRIEPTVAELASLCRAFKFAGSRLSLNFCVGVTEALANAILYGNRKDPGKPVQVRMALNEVKVTIEVRDQGSGFDLRRVPDPTLPENLERVGGRGIYLIHQLMDEVEYLGSGNSVRLVLYRNGPVRRAAG